MLAEERSRMRRTRSWGFLMVRGHVGADAHCMGSRDQRARHTTLLSLRTPFTFYLSLARLAKGGTAPQGQGTEARRLTEVLAVAQSMKLALRSSHRLSISARSFCHTTKARAVIEMRLSKGLFSRREGGG